MASILAAREALKSLCLSTSCRSASLIQRRGLDGSYSFYGIKNVNSWKDPKSPSGSKDEHEIMFICVDTSKWMLGLGHCYQLQLDCVQSYCRTKLKFNPRNAIGIETMGTLENTTTLEPTSDFDKILTHLNCSKALGGGDFDFLDGLASCSAKLDSYSSNLKRILFFTGGPANIEIDEGTWYGKELKQQGIAVDVVNFCLDEKFVLSKMALDAFVAAANNDNNNSHIEHVHTNSRTLVCDLLSRF